MLHKTKFDVFMTLVMYVYCLKSFVLFYQYNTPIFIYSSYRSNFNKMGYKYICDRLCTVSKASAIDVMICWMFTTLNMLI